MDPTVRATVAADAEGIEFVLFCRARRRVTWPELYDEMWAVASRGLFRGYGFDDLREHGIGFGLFEMHCLAHLVQDVIAQEPALPRRATAPVRRGLAVVGGAGVA